MSQGYFCREIYKVGQGLVGEEFSLLVSYILFFKLCFFFVIFKYNCDKC